MHESLDKLTQKTVDCLISNKPTHNNTHMILNQEILCFQLHRECQIPALKKMMACDSSVPFLVTGPFGTGETGLLATVAVNFLKNRSNRVLICISHL